MARPGAYQRWIALVVAKDDLTIETFASVLFPNVIRGSKALFSCLIEVRVRHHSRGPRSYGMSRSASPGSWFRYCNSLPSAKASGFTFLRSAPLAEIRCVLYICKVASLQGLQSWKCTGETLNPKAWEYMGREEGTVLWCKSMVCGLMWLRME